MRDSETTPERLSIAAWDTKDRPREKLMEHGPAVLSDAELLAIVIGSGSLDESAVALMRRVLSDCNNSLRTLGQKSIEELCLYKGIGPAKAVSIAAVCEIGKRRGQDNALPAQFTNSKDIYRCVAHTFIDLPHEETWVLMLNNSLRFVNFKRISKGGLTMATLDVRILLRECLLHHATHLVLVHNHPSGNCTPSAADDSITKKVKEAANTLDLRLIDHLVVTPTTYYSYADNDRITTI